MSRAGAKGYCGCGSIISITISIIFIWLAFRTLTPTCTIEEFDVSALQKHNNTHTIHYDLKLKNRNFNKGIYYNTLNLSFYYKPSHGFPVGNVSIAPFYQGYWKSAHRVGDVEARGVKWENGNGGAVFRVELATEVRYKGPLWKTKRRRLAVGGDLMVDSRGSLIKGKGNHGIKLRSASQRNRSCFRVMGILGILLVLMHFA